MTVGIAPMAGPRQLYIGGRWRDAISGATFSTNNPSTGEHLAQVAEAGPDDIDIAVKAAREALRGPWSRFTPSQRQRVLLRLADLVEEHLDELHLIEVHDQGAPLGARQMAAASGEMIRYFAGWATKIHGKTVDTSSERRLVTYTRKVPVGVVGGIVPWNGPLGAALWKLGPALAAGCTLVLKPAEQAPLSPLRLAQLMEELDLPPGVFNVLPGMGASAGAHLAAHPGVDKISFTGSVETGKAVMHAAAGNLKHLTLELGGKSPHVIFADADLDRAVESAATGIFGGSGQVCCAGSRIFVQRQIEEEFVARLTERAGALRVGPSIDPSTEVGPVVSEGQVNRVASFLKAGHDEGAHATTGGERMTRADLAAGYFIPPTVFTGVRDDMSIAREEIFGPVACVLPFDTFDEVVERANQTEFGLAAGVWTKDLSTAHRFVEASEAGTVWVNTYMQFDPAMPFGGFKQSGFGKELGQQALDGHLNDQAVWIDIDESEPAASHRRSANGQRKVPSSIAALQ